MGIIIFVLFFSLCPPPPHPPQKKKEGEAGREDKTTLRDYTAITTITPRITNAADNFCVKKDIWKEKSIKIEVYLDL